MKKNTLMLFAFIIVLFSSFRDQNNIVITSPADNARVAQREIVRGKVNNHNLHVWVIIHPMSGNQYWVQPKVTIKQDGQWSVQSHFGRPNMDSNENFEVKAVAEPLVQLKEGDILANWPVAKFSTSIIEVIRR